MDKKEFSYNSKFYKTEAAMKKAKTMNKISRVQTMQ